jgi:hypothetical protein
VEAAPAEDLTSIVSLFSTSSSDKRKARWD